MSNSSFHDLKNKITEYLLTNGIDYENKKKFSCLNPLHTDHHPSMSYDPKGQRVHCFSCGISYDLFDLIGLFEGIPDKKGQLHRAKQLYGLPDKEQKNVSHQPTKEDAQSMAADRLEYARKHLEKTEYIQKRGISMETAQRLQVGYDPEAGAILFPTHEGGYEARSTSEKSKMRITSAKGCSKGFFNVEALHQREHPVFVVEGPFDALSVMEAGGVAVALCGTGHIYKFLTYFEQIPEANRPLLALCLDGDSAGQKAQKQLENSLKQWKAEYILPDIIGQHKDPNAAIMADRAGFFQAVAQANTSIFKAKQNSYLETYSGQYALKYFMHGLADTAAMYAYPTGFAGLDDELGGGLREGLYVLGAISGAGKTTLAMQIADHLARAGQHVLIFTLEMARTELIARSLSRNTYMHSLAQYGRKQGHTQPYSFSTLGITAPERWKGYHDAERLAIQQACQDYESYADHLFYVEGMGDISTKEVRRSVEKHQRLFDTNPIVIVDYLQLLAAAETRYTDKQNMDKAALELKRISRDYKTPTIAVSSFNRSSYGTGANMAAFKESGAIEYSSDVLLGLQLQGQDEKGGKELMIGHPHGGPIREMELKILKNRNGPAGAKIALDYYAKYNFFEEQSTALHFADLRL
jgi:Replicative DNA helicase